MRFNFGKRRRSIRKTARVAAKWWAKGMVERIEAAWWRDAESKKNALGAAARFENELRRRLRDELEKHNAMLMQVDYAPDQFLGEILAAIGIEDGKFVLPIKSSMRIRGHHITVRAGRDQPEETIATK